MISSRFPVTQRAVVIGTGFMGWVHVEALRRAGVEPLGVLGSTPEKTQRAAAQYQVPRAYIDLDAVLTDAEVDAVHIATPNRLHYPMAKAALLAGKHVLCEKPLTMTSDESAELVELAVSRPRQAAAVNYNIRFYPLCQELRQRVANGQLGRVFSITGSYVQDWLLREDDYNWRVLREAGGDLRAVADIGTHWMDLATWISGQKIDAVLADLHTVHEHRLRPLGEVETYSSSSSNAPSESIRIDTEDLGNILLRFSDGARGCLHVSQMTAGRKNCLRLEIAAEQRSASWNSEQPNELWLGNRDEANRQLLRDPALLTEAARRFAQYPGGHNEGYADSFKQCFRAFYDYIAAEDADRDIDFPSFDDGHREVLACEAILRSHEQQQWISLKGAD